MLWKEVINVESRTGCDKLAHFSKQKGLFKDIHTFNVLSDKLNSLDFIFSIYIYD